MADHARKLTDGYTTWTQTLTGTDVDLTTVTDVTLYVEAPDGTTVVSDQSVNVVDSETVSYQFGSSELSQTGGHDAEFHVDHSGTIEILPEDDYFEVRVYDDLS